MESIGKGTAKGLIEYLGVLVDKGRATSGAITPLRTAFEKVMVVVEGEEWENIATQSIDVEDYIARFANLTRGKYSPKSITVYKSRIHRVLGWYRRFMSEEEAGWMPTLGTRRVKSKETTKNTPPKQSVEHNIQEAEATASGYAPNENLGVRNGLLPYPFPLTDGTIAQLKLPAHISKDDADRMAAFIKSLVVSSEHDQG